MLNDRSTPLSLLETRRSARPREMVDPGPSPEELERILAIAVRTPDHGKLAPWRFIVVECSQRAEFAALLHRALAESNPDATDAHYAKEEEFAHQGSALVILISSPIEGHKIPVWEQQLSCGAVGMNLLHAAHALGFVGGWLTGWRAYSPAVTEAFCEPGERIAGFLFFGSPSETIAERPRPALEDVVRTWEPEQIGTRASD